MEKTIDSKYISISGVIRHQFIVFILSACRCLWAMPMYLLIASFGTCRSAAGAETIGERLQKGRGGE